MKHRPLGTATVTAVGSGDVRLKTAAHRGIDARDAERALREALELGISLVDVGDEEEAERMCGIVVRELGLRDRVVLATHIPVVPPRLGALYRDLLPDRLPAKYVQERIEGTLRATRLDVLPLAQLPLKAAWRESTAWPELVGTCARLTTEGKVKQWGAVVDDLDRASELVESWLVSLQVTFSLCVRDAEPVLAAAAGKLAILARMPLAGGALAGTLGPGVKLAVHDERHSIDDATLERIAVGVAHLTPLVRREPPAARSCPAARAVLDQTARPEDIDAFSVAELALRYVIDRDVIALPRLHRREHIGESVMAASARPLSPDLRARLESLFPAPKVKAEPDERDT